MKLTIENGRARTSASAPPSIISQLKKFEGGARLLNTGQLSFASSPHNISLFLLHAPDAEIVEAEAIDWGVVQTVRPKFREKRKGRFWQADALDKLDKIIAAKNAPKAFAFLYRPGGGKSKSLTDMAMRLYCEGEIDACIILPPNMLVAEQWVGDHGALSTDVQDDVQVSKWLWGKTKSAQREYEDLKRSEGCQFISMNIDAAKTPRGSELLQDFISHHKGRVLFAVDESHLIKTPSSGRYKKCLALGHLCNWRAILTGTPISKSLVDAWAQFKFLDERILGFRYITAFKSKFCVTRWNGFANEIVGHKNTEEFYRRIEPFCVRVSEKDMGLDKVYDVFEFAMHPEQKKHYDEVKQKWLTALDNGEFSTASIALTAAMRMHQITSGFVQPDEGDLYHFAKNARLDALHAWLETQSDDKNMDRTSFFSTPTHTQTGVNHINHSRTHPRHKK